ncbi:LodA/GoxA family CTQ-dependent oxidase [Aetokthonos hydrillicola Thurmond2011]|uniref:LodA/GoxA family CTQ-dependent oxidase n=1 Tax=Aetokthonos hydrillicola Thurmond2011 TaxID=2712845 RepID=A0AAP5M3P3_9CYAN|nr:LodA/GoxA family CTQ-dependent oxidase [Aetokthonos hydrillicola]MBO3457319.1 hypothetical protein [Aetokthonos hydrillicola CCALA 1050]MBW4586667.1 LodA/GoxA family CTQ-dependent oxidase [Aetokthonos hydrillicola CCALA 1050]MDR9894006.1 LodA/GoxA family CTQ-dependent oxidase [Aetokthonos hydrillicola Thurmond2011]
MAKIYKIHPSIGIARVGNSPDKFYVGSEIPGVAPVEIVNGEEKTLQKYKDENGRLKRQAARFRIFEFEQDATGVLSSGREITANEATIEWQVHLVNSKAAGQKFNNDSGALRNPGVERKKLTIDPGERSISGQQQQGVKFDGGKFLGVEVYLGELQTDASGRLLVLGGRGNSASVPDGVAIQNFANNDKWHDDVSDGTVTAKITFPGQTPRNVDQPAWVIVTPPDFAPEIEGIVTLYDIAFQVAVTRRWLSAPTKPSFKTDIFPIINRAASLRWVNQWDIWNAIPRDWEKLSSQQDSSAQLRQQVFDFLSQPPLAELQLTKVQLSMLQQWKAGNFVDDWTTPPASPLTLTPQNLDRAALELCVGGGFFPGIEGGILLTKPDIYSEPFRLSHQALSPGSITQRMAVPWQADFFDCQGSWWPAQRPDTVQLPSQSGPPSEGWANGIASEDDLVKNFSKLGFVVSRKNSAGEVVFVEEERDPNLPRESSRGLSELVAQKNQQLQQTRSQN